MTRAATAHMLPRAVMAGVAFLLLGIAAAAAAQAVDSTPQHGIPPGVDACTRENRTVPEIVRGMRQEGFFSGGLGGMSNGTWKTWGCWRKHACLDSIGLANKGEAVCYKRSSADGSWMLWGLQREVGVGCSDGWNGTAKAPFANSTPPGRAGTLYPWPLTATKVKYVSEYNYSSTYKTRSLTPVAGHVAGVVTFATIAISDKGWNKYFGGVLGPDGKIVFVPWNADNIGVYDPSTGNFSTIDIANKISGSDKYGGGVLGPDGKIVFVPHQADNIGVYDPLTGSFSTIDISNKISGGRKYTGGVLGPDGKIVFVPQGADNIGVYDPSTGNFSTIDIPESNKGCCNYQGGVLGPDGKIVFVPHYADNIGVYDPSTLSFSAIDISNKISMDTKYTGGVMGPDGKIVFVPCNADKIGVYDPSTGNFSTIDISTDTHLIGNKFFGGILGPDGKIVFVPLNADNIGVYDPSTGSFSTIGISDKISTDFKYGGGVLGPDGKIVFVPHYTHLIGVLEVGNRDLAYEVSGGIPEAWSALLSPHFNKF